MTRPLFFTALSVLLLHSTLSFSQPFNTIEHIDVNNINTAVLVHGDMNWDYVAQKPACEFPKGSGLHVSSAAAIWMSGYDPNSQLRTSTLTHRQTGNDYWPGPLDNTGSLNMATSTQWAKIWKVNFFDINNHIANTTHTVNNTPQTVLEWPAKGNPYAKGNGGVSLTITTDMAPFVDVNADGNYNPLEGDYPDMKGDQMLWWVYSDNGPTHDNAQTQALGMEVHAKAYAYKRNTLIDNLIYYEMEFNNRSTSYDYINFRLGLYADMDLGHPYDDYIGFDSARRLGYVYNGYQMDGTSQNPGYGNTPPVAGYTFLQMPGDNGSNKVPAGSFMTFNNDNSVYGNPKTAVEYDYYLHSRFRDGQQLKYDYVAGVNSNGRGSGPFVNYMYDGDPANLATWSECGALNPPGDRSFVLATNDYTFNHNTSTTIAFALVVADRDTNNACPGIDITRIKTVTDTAWKNYTTPPKSYVSVAAIAKGMALGLSPNPAKNILNIHTPFSITPGAEIGIYDVTGKKMNAPYAVQNKHVQVNTESLSPGVYTVLYRAGSIRQSGIFTKE